MNDFKQWPESNRCPFWCKNVRWGNLVWCVLWVLCGPLCSAIPTVCLAQAVAYFANLEVHHDKRRWSTASDRDMASSTASVTFSYIKAH